MKININTYISSQRFNTRFAATAWQRGNGPFYTTLDPVGFSLSDQSSVGVCRSSSSVFEYDYLIGALDRYSGPNIVV